jgi:hypothetical protein
MEPADLALVLAMDTSGSVSDGRLGLQIEGYADAIGDPVFVRAIQSGRQGRIALTFVQWSSADWQRQLVGWALIDDLAAALRFAAEVRRAPRPIPGVTSISGAIDFSAALLRRAGLDRTRAVIDVSGDGRNNDGRPVRAAVEDAVASGITINGLPIIGLEPDIDDYYRREVIGGPGAFALPAREPSSFGQSLLQKLLLEVAVLDRPVSRRPNLL